MSTQTAETVIDLQEDVEYYATITIVSYKGEEQVKVTVERGPSSYMEDAPEDALVEIPASWTIAERILDIMNESNPLTQRGALN